MIKHEYLSHKGEIIPTDENGEAKITIQLVNLLGPRRVDRIMLNVIYPTPVIHDLFQMTKVMERYMQPVDKYVGVEVLINDIHCSTVRAVAVYGGKGGNRAKV